MTPSEQRSENDEAPQADPLKDVRERVVAAALPHVAFDGWSDKTIAYAVEDAGVDPAMARLAFPRGGIDLALGYHYTCDERLRERLVGEDLLGLRFRDRVAHALMLRLEMMRSEREAVRRAAALFALPNNAPDGARAIWNTADVIWRALGDESRDYNWYTKRATLSGIYSASLLYWLGDESHDMDATRAFVRRRVDDVMQFEGVKAAVKRNPIAAAVLKGPQRLLDRVRAPDDSAVEGLPGVWRRRS
jgi:ubiquinone biosynthesis protein COQ9